MRGRAERLPFADTSFDALLVMTALEFVEDVGTSVREAVRVVRPGGRLVFGVLNGDSAWAAQRRRQGGLWSSARFLREQDLRDLLTQFGPIQIEYAVHLPPQARILPPPLMATMDTLLRRISPRRGAFIGVGLTKGGA
jgi:SAM-dependent methyltransferase